MVLLTFKPNQVTKNLVSVLKDRNRDIIMQRYGLFDGTEKRKTLEAIGDKYGITRERVRQIENYSLDAIKKSESFKLCQKCFSEIKDIFMKKGIIVSEQDILDYLSENPAWRNHIHFLLVLGDDFVKLKEDDYFNHRWTIDTDYSENVHNALKKLHSSIKNDDLISKDEITSYLRKHSQDVVGEKIDDNTLYLWLKLSKIVSSNPLGEWGLSSSPSIKPRGIRDLIFLTLRNEGSPLHFTEVSKKIIDYFKKAAHPATVHNELIKDKRFVLVGRGLYALSDWGYRPGVVKDVIRDIIKAQGPLSKDEIIKAVLKERHVKENTIMVNLQNNKLFKRNKEGKYVIV